MKVNVIVTKKNNRKWKDPELELVELGVLEKIGFDDLFQYEEISIVGGEPMLISERVVEMIHRLRLQGYQGKIYLYTATSHKLNAYWACKMLLDEVDGVIYTVNYGKMESVKRDLTDLRRLDHYFKESGRSGKLDTLYIDTRVYDSDYVDTLEYKWVEIFEKVEKAPLLPEGKTVFYDLEAEG